MPFAALISRCRSLLRSLSEKEFETDAAIEKLEWFKSVYSPLYEQFFARFPGAGSEKDAYGSINSIKDFLKNRSKNIETMIKYIEKTESK